MSDEKWEAVQSLRDSMKGIKPRVGETKKTIRKRPGRNILMERVSRKK